MAILECVVNSKDFIRHQESGYRIEGSSCAVSFASVRPVALGIRTPSSIIHHPSSPLSSILILLLLLSTNSFSRKTKCEMVQVSPAFLLAVASCFCLPSVVWCSSNHVGNNELGPLTPSSPSSSLSLPPLFGIVPRGGASSEHTSWTFDLPCTKMPWTPMASTSLNLVTNIENADDIDSSEYDLIIVGVTAPTRKNKSEDSNEPVSKKKNKKTKNNEETSTKPSLIQLDPYSIADYININHNGIIDQILEDEGSSFKVKHNSMTSTVRISIPAASDDSTNANAKKLLKFVLLGFDTTLDQNDDTTQNENNSNNKNDDDIKAKGRKIGSALASLVGKEMIKKKNSNNGGGKVLVVMPVSTRIEQVPQNDGDIDGGSPSSLFLEEMASSFYTDLYKDQRFKGTAGMDDDDSSSTTSVHLVWDSCNPPSQDESLVVSESGDNHDYGDTKNNSAHEEPAQYQLSDNEIHHALDRGRQMALGVYMAKDIVNSPHNTLNSVSLADTAQKICAENSGEGTLSCQILDMKECEKRGMGSYLAVARGSETVPKFIHITYRPKRNTYRRKSDLRKLGVVGKGLLFDTGGYNIKTAMMELMKFDCGGAAAVLGAARAIGALGPKGVEVHFVVAACENMINERAVVPGDVITASNGKTIEVINTDAEGRLTMADALVYIDKEIGCEEIIELSTLTGACMISLGSAMAGLWTDYDELATKLQSAASSTGDKVWRMPMAKEYKDQIKSKIADLRNLGTVRYGGAIHAALFLQEFVSKDKPFAHIDMAGPVWSNKIGATGYGAKLVTEWVCNESRK